MEERGLDRLVGARTVASVLGVSPDTVSRWVRENRIPYVRLSSRTVRFDPDAVADWVAEREHAGKPHTEQVPEKPVDVRRAADGTAVVDTASVVFSRPISSQTTRVR